MLHAVIAGVDRYRDESIPNLRCASADARALAELLERRIQPDERNVRLFLDEDATRRALTAAVGDDLPREVEADDLVLIYFAGHGSPERMGVRDKQSRYLLPYDAEFARIHTTGIDLERDVADWLTGLRRAKVVVLVLDACFSGAAGGRTILGPLLAARPYLDVLAEPRPVSIRNLELGRGRAILCAAGDDQVAREQPETGHGIFTRHFIAELCRSRAGARVIDLLELYRDIELNVRRETQGQQEPVISALQLRHASLPCLSLDL